MGVAVSGVGLAMGPCNPVGAIGVVHRSLQVGSGASGGGVKGNGLCVPVTTFHRTCLLLFLLLRVGHGGCMSQHMQSFGRE